MQPAGEPFRVSLHYARVGRTSGTLLVSTTAVEIGGIEEVQQGKRCRAQPNREEPRPPEALARGDTRGEKQGMVEADNGAEAEDVVVAEAEDWRQKQS